MDSTRALHCVDTHIMRPCPEARPQVTLLHFPQIERSHYCIHYLHMHTYLPHVKVGSESVHVDVSILLQFRGKLWGQGRVQGRGKIPQGVLQGLLFSIYMWHHRDRSIHILSNLLFVLGENRCSGWCVRYARIPATLGRRERIKR